MKYVIRENFLPERGEACTLLVLQRLSKKNALNVAFREELIASLEDLARNDSVKALFITGQERCFSAGFDLKEGMNTELASFDHRFEAFFRSLYFFPKPLVTLVNGDALAGGFDLALAGDIIIASANARFGHPEIKFGVVPLQYPLRRRISACHAYEMVLTGKIVNAEEALRMGLINEVVEGDLLIQRGRKLAQHIATLPTHQLLSMKETMRFLDNATVEQAISHELQRYRKLTGNREVMHKLSGYLETIGSKSNVNEGNFSK